MLLEQGLEGLYYIICTNEETNWWQLRKTDDHQVVACGVGKDFVLGALKRQVEKYPTKKLVQEKWNSLEYTKPLKREELEQRRLQYEVVKDISKEETDKITTVSQKPTVRRRLKPKTPPLLIEEEKLEEVSAPTSNSGTIRRRRLIKK